MDSTTQTCAPTAAADESPSEQWEDSATLNALDRLIKHVGLHSANLSTLQQMGLWDELCAARDALKRRLGMHRLTSQWNVSPMEASTSYQKAFNIIDKAAHYNTGRFEVIDVIEDWDLDFHLGNVVKYIARHAHKGKPLEDLKKARYYLDRSIKLMEAVDDQG